MTKHRNPLLAAAATLALAGALVVPALAQGPRAERDRPALRAEQQAERPARPGNFLSGARGPQAGGPHIGGPQARGPHAPGILGHHRPGGPMAAGDHTPFWQDDEIAEAIGLSPAQKLQLEAERAAFRERMEAHREAMRESAEARRDARPETPGTPRPLAEVHADIDAASAAHAQRLKDAATHRQAMHNILTEAQREALREHMQANRPERPAMGRGLAAHARPGAGDPELMREVGALVRDLRADGGMSPEDWAKVRELLQDAPPEVRQRVREMRERMEARAGEECEEPAGPRGPQAGAGERAGQRERPAAQQRLERRDGSGPARSQTR